MPSVLGPMLGRHFTHCAGPPARGRGLLTTRCSWAAKLASCAAPSLASFSRASSSRARASIRVLPRTGSDRRRPMSHQPRPRARVSATPTSRATTPRPRRRTATRTVATPSTVSEALGIRTANARRIGRRPRASSERSVPRGRAHTSSRPRAAATAPSGTRSRVASPIASRTRVTPTRRATRLGTWMPERWISPT